MWLVGEAIDSRLLVALGYTGFMLNLFNLLPSGRSTVAHVAFGRMALRLGNRERLPWADASARLVAGVVIYGGLVVLLVLGMVAAHVQQNRL